MPSDETPSGTRWTCRKLEPDDQGFLWEMLYIALWDPPDEPRRPRSVLESPHVRPYVEDWGRNGNDDFAMAACPAGTGKPVGAVWTRLGTGKGNARDDGCDYPELGIGIQPEFQGRGIGSLLMKEFTDSLRSRVPGLRLGVHPRNTPARRLYEKFGFIEFAVGPGDYPQMKVDFPESGNGN